MKVVLNHSEARAIFAPWTRMTESHGSLNSLVASEKVVGGVIIAVERDAQIFVL